jgi:hypothetical protein
METLGQAPAITPQIIMSLCTISITICNKMSELIMPFHGDKIRLRINVTTGEKTFNWLFNMGASITCMNANSFNDTFNNGKPKLIKLIKVVLLQTESN